MDTHDEILRIFGSAKDLPKDGWLALMMNPDKPGDLFFGGKLADQFSLLPKAAMGTMSAINGSLSTAVEQPAPSSPVKRPAPSLPDGVEGSNPAREERIRQSGTSVPGLEIIPEA